MNKITTYITLALSIMLLAACDSQEALSSNDEQNMIHVGGVNTDPMVTTATVTRSAVAAETLDWLKEGLTQGMNMQYYKEASAKQKAILKLEADGTYSMKTPDGTVCKWLGNGKHAFEGVYVPSGLKAQNTTQNYDDLIHYTAIPPSTEIAATVGKITIPLQHRLARVLAYVLIDQSMNAKLKGYDASNYNAEETKLRFCNVKTLNYVDANGLPVWKEERKAIPHYLGEYSVKLYKDKSSGKLIFPTDDDWQGAQEDYTANGDKNYTCTDYGKVPCYDLIVRPTYTVAEEGTNVMYDEAVPTAEGKNNIDFELTLDNDLEYEKQFTFDLNANDETVVFLRVSPERIDYNSAGSRLWKESANHDNYYGVNNQNGNNLSKAGSSWQRAYTNSTLDTGVTDGHFYNADSEDEEAQYVDDSKWIEMLLQAYKGGTHHGDYFILKKDITINTNDYVFPSDFTFTGHLDALDHTITITGSRAYLFNGLNGTYKTNQEDDKNATWEANVHLEGDTWVPTTGWRAEVVNMTLSAGKMFKDGATITGYVNNCKDADGAVANHTPAIPTY
jgi:hypothetical protein